MKLLPFLVLGLLFFACSNENSKTSKVSELPKEEETVDNMIESSVEIIKKDFQKEEVLLSIEKVKSELLPMKIQFGAIGKGDGLPPTILTVDVDSVRIITRKQQYFSLPIDETNYLEIFQKFAIGDFKGDVRYGNRMIHDGGYMLVTNELGSRKFINTFSRLSKPKHISPDTVGLSKFRNIYDTSTRILIKFRRQGN